MLSFLNNLDYAVEWRIINAADYGYPQKRRRAFIFATLAGDTVDRLYGGRSDINVIMERGFFDPEMPCVIENRPPSSSVHLWPDLVRTTEEFKLDFQNAGYLRQGRAYTVKVSRTPSYERALVKATSRQEIFMSNSISCRGGARVSHRRRIRPKEITTYREKGEFFPCPPSSREQAKKLLELAKHDLDASNVLREKQLFALSVFHMQQGFEKALKAEMYLTGLYSDKDIKGFGHDVMKASEDLQKKMANHAGWTYDDLGQKELNDYARGNREDAVRLNYDQICDMLYPPIDGLEFHYERLRSLGWSGLQMEAVDAVLYTIHILSVLLAFHEQSSRYIDARDSDLTPFDYNSELGIVKALPVVGWKLELIVGELEWSIDRAISKERLD